MITHDHVMKIPTVVEMPGQDAGLPRSHLPRARPAGQTPSCSIVKCGKFLSLALNYELLDLPRS